MFHILAGNRAAAEILGLAGEIMGEDPRAIAAQRLPVNAVAQPVLCAVQLATWAALRDRLPEPRVFAGYSVGELASHGCAGSLDPAETITLAMRRAAVMDSASPVPGSLMAVRGLLRQDLERLCRAHGLEIAIVNDVDRLVVGGPLDDLDGFEPELVARGAKVTRLRITIASHTSQMLPAIEPFRKTLESSALRNSSIPILAGIDGTPVTTRQKAVDTLSTQLARTVDWAACMDGLAEMGCTMLLELGPCNGLSRMVRDRLPHIPVRAVSEFQSLDGVINWVERML
ncbi:Malonyl CoA acyl carrier protein transacylase [Paramagnetospirillum magnetotacticum MS-1]|uniref:Malonyl CoA acyl carrier protein transacylase n=2 Tax=Paramagnetospirillum magnetotacticum TaxID=188 RepID=A0A0C2YPY3_PARME|nr:Malonyl CoA acyl carrier protein transacylase [Paramagnetospirillum magnetotacticum MS-1]